jgi:hypothetical protein
MNEWMNVLTEHDSYVPCYVRTQKVMQPNTGLNRPLRLHKFDAPRLSRQSAHEGGKVVSPTHWPPLPPKRYPWYSFLLKRLYQPPGHSDWKIPITASGTEPATFQLVALCPTSYMWVHFININTVSKAPPFLHSSISVCCLAPNSTVDPVAMTQATHPTWPT